jgi:hypothetical protein
LLCGASADRRRGLLRAVRAASPLFRPIPISLSRHGLRIWES